MTCRTIACLPALTGAYAHPHGGALLGSSGTFGPGDTVLERRDLLPSPPPRTINMVQLGRALTDPALRPPVMALYVYNSNPAAVCPNSSLVLEGLAREDLFTVVHEQVHDGHGGLRGSPASGDHQHGAHGLLPVLRPPLPPAGGAGDRTPRGGPDQLGGLRPAGPRHGDARPPLRDAAAGAHRRASPGRGPGHRRDHPRTAPAPSARRGSPCRVRSCPLRTGRRRRRGESSSTRRPSPGRGCPPLPTYAPLREGRDNPAIGRALPAPLPRPPNRFFLNSSFSQSAPAPGAAGGPDGARPSGRRGRPGDRRGGSRCRSSTTGAGALHRRPVGRHAARPGGDRGDLVAQVHAGWAGRQRPHLRRSRRHGRGARRSTRRWSTLVGRTPRRRRSPATPSVEARRQTPGPRTGSREAESA